MTAFATTANAVALPVDAVPVASVEGFRRDVLATVAGGRRLLLLTGASGADPRLSVGALFRA